MKPANLSLLKSNNHTSRTERDKKCLKDALHGVSTRESEGIREAEKGR
jgi:hypothetical protein